MDERRYRAYVTDALMILSENVAGYIGGKTMTARWAEPYIPKDTRTGDEIAAEVIKNAGLIQKDGETGWIYSPSPQG